MRFWYCATPYSKFHLGIEAAFEQACIQAALLISAGISVYFPICHTHPIAMQGGIDPLDHEIWLPADRAFMDAAKGLIVCKMDGWQDSYGVGVEIETFKAAGKPVVFMEPGVVPEGVE